MGVARVEPCVVMRGWEPGGGFAGGFAAGSAEHLWGDGCVGPFVLAEGVFTDAYQDTDGQLDVGIDLYVLVWIDDAVATDVDEELFLDQALDGGSELGDGSIGAFVDQSDQAGEHGDDG
jgi:hypothetical protein